jgi:aminoglycoside/choline kinase family phosphotransferase
VEDDRLRELADWLVRDCGLRLEALAPASSDASFRRYFRVTSGGETYVAMDAPPEREGTEAFRRIAGWLAGMELEAPRVLAADPDRGFLLLTDLGEELYLERLRARPGEADRLYGAAIRALAKMQALGAAHVRELPPYDRTLLETEMTLFRDWLCMRHLSLVWSAAEESAWRELVAVLTANALAMPAVFVHRDYHSRNLMVTRRPPGILDFQDAVAGPPVYDLVSLLKDCYIAWPRDRVLDWATEYRHAAAERGLDTWSGAAEFLRTFDLMGVQRHLKAAGIFARLWHRDGKSGYLADVPRTLGYVTAIASDYPELDWLNGLIESRVLPALSGSRP